jgi:hypothetical protein
LALCCPHGVTSVTSPIAKLPSIAIKENRFDCSFFASYSGINGIQTSLADAHVIGWTIFHASCAVHATRGLKCWAYCHHGNDEKYKEWSEKVFHHAAIILFFVFFDVNHFVTGSSWRVYRFAIWFQALSPMKCCHPQSGARPESAISLQLSCSGGKIWIRSTQKG